MRPLISPPRSSSSSPFCDGPPELLFHFMLDWYENYSFLFHIFKITPGVPPVVVSAEGDAVQAGERLVVARVRRETR